MAAMTRIGFGQVEPNHLSKQFSKEIYAQLPAKSTITQLENGQFAKYDYAAGEVNFTGEGEWLLVFNEVKLYRDEETYKDFALQTKNFTDGKMTPRLMATAIGDIYTTNCLKAAGAKDATTTMEDYAVGDHLIVDTTGFLKKDGKTSSAWNTTTGMIWKVVKVYTMPDGQEGIKIQRIN